MKASSLAGSHITLHGIHLTNPAFGMHMLDAGSGSLYQQQVPSLCTSCLPMGST